MTMLTVFRRTWLDSSTSWGAAVQEHTGWDDCECRMNWLGFQKSQIATLAMKKLFMPEIQPLKNCQPQYTLKIDDDILAYGQSQEG